MLRNILFYLLVGTIIGLPLLFGLGNDMVAKDDYHFKNWSYVFMKEFEDGNYDRLYVSVQPGVLTIYSNIVGFKGLYFTKDKLNLVSVEGKDFEILLHFAQKLPKVLLIIIVGVAIAYLLERLINRKFAFLFITLLALEPYVIGQSRVIQTDALPMYLGFLSLLILYYHRKYYSKRKVYTVLVGFLLGLCVLEKSLYFVLVALISLEILFKAFQTKSWKYYFKELLLFSISVFITMILLFPAFWGDFLFTLYRITIGSFVFGVQGYDTETFSYEKTHHIKPIFYYLRFLINKVSGIVILGVGIALLKQKEYKQSVLNNLLLIVYPILMFVLLMVAEKKIGRYMLAIYPYIILLSTVGYYKILKTKRLYQTFIIVFILLRLFQFTTYYPDFLMYRNPLSIDRSFDNSAEAWGSGRKKLAKYINNTYGQDKIIYAGDYTTLDIFYSGTVLNKDDYVCNSNIDLLITMNPNEHFCGEFMASYDSYEPYKDLLFYIYVFDR